MMSPSPIQDKIINLTMIHVIKAHNIPQSKICIVHAYKRSNKLYKIPWLSHDFCHFKSILQLCLESGNKISCPFPFHTGSLSVSPSWVKHVFQITWLNQGQFLLSFNLQFTSIHHMNRNMLNEFNQTRVIETEIRQPNSFNIFHVRQNFQRTPLLYQQTQIGLPLSPNKVHFYLEAPFDLGFVVMNCNHRQVVFFPPKNWCLNVEIWHEISLSELFQDSRGL